MELIPPLESLHAPGVIHMDKLLAKEDVEACQLDTFPFLPPHFHARQSDICLRKGEC